jgi:hypothetical protein
MSGMPIARRISARPAMSVRAIGYSTSVSVRREVAAFLAT